MGHLCLEPGHRHLALYRRGASGRAPDDGGTSGTSASGTRRHRGNGVRPADIRPRNEARSAASGRHRPARMARRLRGSRGAAPPRLAVAGRARRCKERRSEPLVLVERASQGTEAQMSTTAEQIDLTRPEFWMADPYPTLARLRAADPVHYHDTAAHPFWALTRHDDIVTVSKSPETFCSGKGIAIQGGSGDDMAEFENLVT